MTNTLEKRMGRIEDSVDKLAIKVEENIKLVEDLAISIKNILDQMAQMVTKTEFNERMDRIEFRFNEHDRRIENLEDKVGLISRKIGLSRK